MCPRSRKRAALLEALESRVLLSISTIFDPSSTPPEWTDTRSVELGVKFRTTTPGYINGIRFYKGPNNLGLHIGHLWDVNGTPLGTVTFTSETASGWQQANFTSPIPIAANHTYVASYLAPVGRYSYTYDYFTGSSHTSSDGLLTGLASGTDGPNGIYLYTNTGAFPNLSFRDLNYWVDVAFEHHAPSDINLSNSSVPENQPAGTPVGTLTAVDADPPDNFNYSLVTGAGDADNASFSINGAVLETEASFNFEVKNSYSIRVRATDSSGDFTEKVFTIDVTNVAESPPTDILLSNNSVPENQPVDTSVGNFSTVDADLIDSFTYALVSGTGSDDNASFTISGNVLKTTASFDFETKSAYSIRVRSTDSDGSFTEKVFTVNVTDVAEFPPTDILLSNNSVPENQPINTTVGNLSTVDADLIDSFTYTLVSGTGSDDNTSFTISGNALKTAASFDFETKSAYSIRVRSTDSEGSFTEKVFTVNVTDVAEFPPTDILLSNNSVPENQPINTTVGNLSTVDADLIDSFTYTLASGTGSDDNTSFTISGNTLKTAASFDFETKNAYSIRVRSTDSEGSFTEKVFTVNVTDVAEFPPTDISLSNNSIPENQPVDTTVGNFSTVDADLIDTFTYTLVSGTGSDDNASFTISGNTLKTAASFDFETKNTYSIRVHSTDSEGSFTEEVFTIDVTNVAEANNSVVGRALFYLNSPAFGGTDHDSAIATDKQALLPGQTATFANYSSYDRGINGIMVDIAGTITTLGSSDFIFKVGNDNAPDAWTAAPDLPSITIRAGAGFAGSTRIELTWADHAIQNEWLQVTVKSDANTGIPADDVFYFGNAIGESGNSPADAKVTAVDEIGARVNPGAALINSAWDYNRDGIVNPTDQDIARTHVTNFMTALNLIAPPVPPAAPLVLSGGGSQVAAAPVSQPALLVAAPVTVAPPEATPNVQNSRPERAAHVQRSRVIVIRPRLLGKLPSIYLLAKH